MRPSDPWLRQQLAPARRQLLAVVGGGLVSCGLVLGQAWAVAGLLLAVLRGHELTGPALVLAAVLVARGVVGALGDFAAARAAAVRRNVAAQAARRPPPSSGTCPAPPAWCPCWPPAGSRRPSPTSRATCRHWCSPACCRRSPSSRSPPRTCSVPSSCWPPCRSSPSSAPSSGWPRATGPASSGARCRPSPVTSSTSCVGCRPWSPTAAPEHRPGRIAAITDRYRLASLRTLRIAFASSLVLELVATLSVALVAVCTRRPAGRRVARPAHRPGRPAPRPGGLLAAAPRGGRVPRRSRGRRDLRGRPRRTCGRAPSPRRRPAPRGRGRR